MKASTLKRREGRLARLKALAESTGLIWEGFDGEIDCDDLYYLEPKVCMPGHNTVTFHEGLASAELWIRSWKRWHDAGDSWDVILADYLWSWTVPYITEHTQVQLIEGRRQRRLQKMLQGAPQEHKEELPLTAQAIGA